MNKSAAGIGPLLGFCLKFVAAFSVIKLLSFLIQSDLLRHCSVAAVLILIPLLRSRESLAFFPALLNPPRNLWGTFFCFFYAGIPIAVLFGLYPEEWFRARLDLHSWVYSQAGLAAIIIAPLSEEFFFRGWLLKYQTEFLNTSEAGTARRSWFWICYVNALVFWIFHFPIQPGMFELWRDAMSKGMVPLSPGPFFLGFVASVLTLATGTPRAALVFHMLANAMGPLWWPLLRSESLRSLFYF